MSIGDESSQQIAASVHAIPMFGVALYMHSFRCYATIIIPMQIPLYSVRSTSGRLFMMALVRTKHQPKRYLHAHKDISLVENAISSLCVNRLPYVHVHTCSVILYVSSMSVGWVKRVRSP